MAEGSWHGPNPPVEPMAMGGPAEPVAPMGGGAEPPVEPMAMIPGAPALALGPPDPAGSGGCCE